MDIKDRMRTLEAWYWRNEVKFEMVKFSYNREFAAIATCLSVDEQVKTTTRMVKVHNVQHFEYVINKGLRMFNKNIPYNFYYSLASYFGGIPNQTFNLAERDNSKWNESCYMSMQSYDFLIDIDAKTIGNFPAVHESAKKIKFLLDTFDIGYEIRFSGRGFHFIVPNDLHGLDADKYSFIPHKEESIYTFYTEIAGMLKKYYSEMVDKTIYDYRRVVKIPYSLANYEKAVYVCLPLLSDDAFNSFSPANATIAVLRGHLVHRGAHVFNDVKGNEAKIIKMAEYLREKVDKEMESGKSRRKRWYEDKI